jgi:galactokinase
MTPNKISFSIAEKFRELYEKTPLIARSPGRVNIIGEHTDYNEGFVLPAAIDKAVYVAIGKRDDHTVEMHSVEFSEFKKANLENLKPDPGSWTNYILGVADQLQKRGYKVPGFNIVVDGDVPFGAGLSSSAAVECATAFALNTLFDLKIPREELIFVAQKAEHEFAGVMCGIMDQFASVFGKKDHVMKLDCRSMDFEYVPFEMEGYKILLLNTNVKHSLSSSEYNIRRQQCEQGVSMVKKFENSVNSLRDVTMEMLDRYVAVEPLIYRRCKYVVEENKRLLAGCEDLRNGHAERLGKKMFETHDGLSKLYEVSCPELDYLVDQVRTDPAVMGARMMGGGFGGCTINLVKEQHIPELVNRLSSSYNEAMKLELTSYIASIEDGSSIMSLS